MRFFLCIPALLMVSSPAFSVETAPRTVSVSAQGSVEAVPDRAVLPITIESKDKVLAAAKQKNDKQMDKLLKVAADNGIAQAKLKTSGIYINPGYRYENNKQVFEGYSVNRSIRITIDELDKLEKVIAGLTSAGIDQVQGVEFTVADPEALESAARKKAVEKATAKATELATTAGAKLGRVITINETGGQYPMPMMARGAVAMEMKADSAPPPPLPGTMEVQQSVSVLYELQ